MVLALSVVDSADGTGAVATITGTLGAAVSIYTQQTSPASGFTLTATRVGDGSVALSLGNGYWWAYATLAAGGPSNFVYFPTTSSTKSVWDRCLDALVAIAQGLMLAGAPPVYRQVMPAMLRGPVTCILLSIDDVAENGVEVWSSETQDELHYPVRVRIIDHAAPVYDPKATTYLMWRQQLMRAMRHRTLPGVPEVIRTDIEAEPQFPNADQDSQIYRGGFTVRCWAVEGRV